MKVGIFEVPERVVFPRTHKEMQRQLRGFAESIGLDLRFVNRKKYTFSYCDPVRAKAVVIAKLKGHQFPRVETAHYALHEIAHWMDYNNGLFRDYYARPGRVRACVPPKKKDILRSGVRAEQHCDWLANRMLWAMYGKAYNTTSVYADATQARQILVGHYDIGP